MQNTPIKKRGLHNWRNLFRKPTLNDWMVTIMLIFILIIALFYKMDIDSCISKVDYLLDRMEECGCSIQRNNGVEDFDWSYEKKINMSLLDENSTTIPLDV